MRTFLKATFAALALASAAFSATLEAQAGCGSGYGFGYKKPYGYNSYPVSCPYQRPPVVVAQPLVVPQPGQPVPGQPFPGQPIQGQPIQGQRGAPVEAAQGQMNLQLVDVRLVEPGMPEQKLGPRFRLFVKNASPFGISRPIDLVVAAGIDRKFEQGLPSAVERISGLAPGQVATIEIRLPIESMAMQYPGEEKPAPFSTLFVMVTGQQDLLGNATIKPLAILPRIGIQFVDLALHKPADARVPTGAVVTLAGEGFGIDGGQVILSLGQAKLVGQIVNWGPTAIQVKLPELALATPTAAQIVVARADGQSAPAMEMQIMPAGFAALQQGAAGQGAPQAQLGQGQPGQTQFGQGQFVPGQAAQNQPVQGQPVQGQTFQAAQGQQPSGGEPAATALPPAPTPLTGGTLLQRPAEPAGPAK
ncbi:MAG: hypothetical protein HYS13_04695 [Planctomycetia bacterium]|nr:hypothetical protein [Planctomycetia bacterium]